MYGQSWVCLWLTCNNNIKSKLLNVQTSTAFRVFGFTSNSIGTLYMCVCVHCFFCSNVMVIVFCCPDTDCISLPLFFLLFLLCPTFCCSFLSLFCYVSNAISQNAYWFSGFPGFVIFSRLNFVPNKAISTLFHLSNGWFFELYTFIPIPRTISGCNRFRNISVFHSFCIADRFTINTNINMTKYIKSQDWQGG